MSIDNLEKMFPGFKYANEKLIEQGNELLGEAILMATRDAKGVDGRGVILTIPLELLPSITEALNINLRSWIDNGNLDKIIPPIKKEPL